ncbi:CO(2)-response secreted protease [Linum perenne]
MCCNLQPYMDSLAPLLLRNMITVIVYCLVFPSSSSTSDPTIRQRYVVYMGSCSSSSSLNGGDQFSADSAYLNMLSSISETESDDHGLLQKYQHAFRGFSAMLTQDQASTLSGREGVISVFVDPILKLHTTRSWEFLESMSGSGYSYSSSNYNVGAVPRHDVIIGLIDTGIWPESPSFNDHGIGEIPSKWKGVCMESPDFNKSNCNRKLIGARYYGITSRTYNDNKTRSSKPKGSPRDYVGHGTHTASIAAGSHVPNATYYGLAAGTASGGSPSARIAVYKACSEDGCSGSTILKAMDDAIEDGVDFISISIGSSSTFQPGFLQDPIAIGAFHAMEKGVTVVCSAGNEGPDLNTVVNTAPWIFTAAASNIDRDFQSTLVLGNGKTFKVTSYTFIQNFFINHESIIREGVGGCKICPNFASNCYPGSIDRKKVAGKIVVCVASDLSISRKIRKLVVQDCRARGMILINPFDSGTGVPFDSGTFPLVEIGSPYGNSILKYMNNTKNPKATILASVDVPGYRPAPSVAFFSSRGPGPHTENFLKPDITSPGVSILAAITPHNEVGTVPIGKKPSGYALRSGTSMACPHVTGAAAFVKSVHPKWSPSMIKSALMTTATIYNNMGKPLMNSSRQSATPLEMGAGEINPIKALNPGLVFHTSTLDYLRFLCYYGSSDQDIRSLSPSSNLTCPSNSKNSERLMSSINYPSISIAGLSRRDGVATQTVLRTATNVGPVNSTYVATVRAPSGLGVKVVPGKLVFRQGVGRSTFRVLFNGKEASRGYNFGFVTWRDGRRHSVRLVFAVNVE